MRKTALLVAAGLVLLISLPALAAEGWFDRSLQVNGPVNLDVKTGSGEIVVRPGASNTVRIRGHIVANGFLGLGGGEDKVDELQKNPPIDQSGNSIRIGHRDEDWMDNVSISYTIEVPANTTLLSESGSGGQEISGIKGPVRVHSGSGGIRLSRIGDSVEATTGSGGIDADDIAGAMTLSAGSGHVQASQSKAGDVRVHTGSGGIRLNEIRGGLDAEAGSGHIVVSGEPTSTWHVHTGSGGMELSIPADSSFTLDARTGSGGINIDFPVTMEGSMDRHHVRGRVGNGGVALELETGSGSIQINKGKGTI